jgi:protein FRG1
LGVNHDGDMVVLFEKKEDVSLTLRSLNKRDNNSKKALPDEEKSDDLRNVELNYVKKFQKFQDKRVKLSGEDVTELSQAKDEGRLHESLLGELKYFTLLNHFTYFLILLFMKILDRREKMKADRYCK